MPRPSGAANKNKSFLLKRLQVMYGDDFHPIMKMAENAVSMQALVDEGIEIAEDLDPVDKIQAFSNRANSIGRAVDAWDRVAQYTEPKLKAVELKTGDDGLQFITRVERVIIKD